LSEFKLILNAARSGVDPSTMDEAEWLRAIDIARVIPDDLQAVFLILASAALRGAPCPSDLHIAKRCGQHAPGRARSRIRHLEKSDRLVVRTGMTGMRTIVLPDLGWETGWGDPNAPEVPHAIAAE
jgi:hypothetical protein